VHGREADLQQKQQELEQAEKELRAKAERWRREQQAIIEQIEHDRWLLGQAWERLERQRGRNPAPTPESSPRGPNSQPSVLTMPDPENQRPDATTQQMLRLFESLGRGRRDSGKPRIA
jgi:hypothetical protein